MLNTEQVKAIIPHRDPFLLVDRVDELEPGKRAVGFLDVTSAAFWVPGHFPDYAVMPGVLIVEALAQVGAVALLSVPGNQGRIALFAGIDKVRFKRQVRPGETLRLECEITKTRGPIGFGTARATVDGELACSGELMFAIQSQG
ncbi:MAG: 3-hydroxyacyl-[acyl-carrier-protein] dehydratase FabZ [Actinobacteria bacterium HGW-Actinobacteria-6]|jgi:3-hydroxyacyl-[acyl-carrier-protein] dehydratase|nr:MAG: 3-hydroxyacyl-[acyl-carrier-protein] dehydratase FabZ [Actinobacteria bacterium HGW-Actinobacteria-6]